MQQIHFCPQQIMDLHPLINLLSPNPLSKHKE